jgi:hypothetical protein
VIPAIFWNGESQLWVDPLPVEVDLEAQEVDVVIDAHKIKLRLPGDAEARIPTDAEAKHFGPTPADYDGEHELPVAVDGPTRIWLKYRVPRGLAPKTLQLEIDGLRLGTSALPSSSIDFRLTSDWLVCRSPYL